MNCCKIPRCDKTSRVPVPGIQDSHDRTDDNFPSVVHLADATNDFPTTLQTDNPTLTNNRTDTDSPGQALLELVGIYQTSGSGGQSDPIDGVHCLCGGKSTTVPWLMPYNKKIGCDELCTTLMSVLGMMAMDLWLQANRAVMEHGTANSTGVLIREWVECSTSTVYLVPCEDSTKEVEKTKTRRHSNKKQRDMSPPRQAPSWHVCACCRLPTAG